MQAYLKCSFTAEFMFWLLSLPRSLLRIPLDLLSCLLPNKPNPAKIMSFNYLRRVMLLFQLRACVHTQFQFRTGYSAFDCPLVVRQALFLWQPAQKVLQKCCEWIMKQLQFCNYKQSINSFLMKITVNQL